jgi:hypothetical protein
MIELFKNLLLQADPKVLAQHSRMDHHAIGMHYLCLHRSEAMTVKLYHITDNAENSNSGFLIHPHNHRYMFDTYVLKGVIDHIKFGVNPAALRLNVDQLETKYVNPDVGFSTRRKPGVALTAIESRQYWANGDCNSYRVVPQDIHTLRVSEECVLGLVQYADTDVKTSMYMPRDVKATDLDCTGSVMTEEQYALLAYTLIKKIKATPFAI